MELELSFGALDYSLPIEFFALWNDFSLSELKETVFLCF